MTICGQLRPIANLHLLLCVQVLERIFRHDNVQDSRYRSKNASHITTEFNVRFGRTQGSLENSLHTKGIYCADHGTYIDPALREIYDVYKATLLMPSNRDRDAYDSVWAIIDDGCVSCSRSKAWRQNAEAKMKVLGLHFSPLHKKATTFNGTGRSTKN